MRLLRWSGYLFIVLLAATAVLMGMGSRLPAEHTATATGEIAAPRERVWSMIVDVAKQPGWRTGLKAVEVLSAEGDETCWREVQAWMAMPLCATRSEAPRLRVVQIADPKLPFGGSWTYELEAAGPTSTTLTITERGTTGPAMWRFFGHYVTGEDAQIRQYLRDLGKAAGGGGEGEKVQMTIWR